MKTRFYVAAFLLIGSLVFAGNIQWPHSKQYPVKVKKVVSPTEIVVFLKDEKKTYTLRLAHVAPVEKKNTKENEYAKGTYDLAMRLVENEIKRDPENMFIEFEGDEIQFDGDSTNKIVGYLFLSPTWETPLNCELMYKNTRISDSNNKKTVANKHFTTYMQENGKDSKGKSLFEFCKNVSF